MLESILHWDEIAARGLDASIYFVMAMAATILFLIRLGFALLAGGDADIDDASDVGDSDASFSFFSLLSVLAFFMGAGWMGLACRFDWELGRLTSSFLSAGFGLVMMSAAAGLTWLMRRFNQEAHYDVATAIETTGRVYLTVPARGKGRGQVEVNVSGRRKIIAAVSSGPELQPFTEVIVTSVQDDETMVVRSKYPDGDEAAAT